MQSVRQVIQTLERRFGLLDVSCCDECCGRQVSIVRGVPHPVRDSPQGKPFHAAASRGFGNGCHHFQQAGQESGGQGADRAADVA